MDSADALELAAAAGMMPESGDDLALPMSLAPASMAGFPTSIAAEPEATVMPVSDSLAEGAMEHIAQHAAAGADAPQRKPGSGRPAGVQCKCKCCGAIGFYRRSCGRKHRCLLGKCGPGGPGQMGPAGVQNDGGEIDEAPTMYQVRLHATSFCQPGHY